MVDKTELRKQFSKEWERHYKLDILEEFGFQRRQCKKCKRHFWSINEKDYCGDTSCVGYQFIENPPVKNKLTYQETWSKIKNYFTKHGHTALESYPTVARWRDDVYFTMASIGDFQPYVVTGEIPPPANPLIIPQPCLRFVDISNVGVTGRHYTNFIMVGQHAFNTDKTGLFYWKNEALGHDLAYLQELGIGPQNITIIEDVWAGGGNFGPSMEYFVGGLELGNCVFMQYEETPNGARELKNKVIDMGAGLSRLAWITSGDLMSYDSVFGRVMDYLKKENNINVDGELLGKYARLSGTLNDDEVADIEKEKEKIAGEIGMSKEELFKTLEPLKALYATADHLMTLLYTTTDGMLPSNSGGGYNLRTILRRVFDFQETYNLTYDMGKIMELHSERMKTIVPRLKEGVQSTIDVIAEEKKKYSETKKRSYTKVVNILKSKKELSKKDVALLYESHGITPVLIESTAEKLGLDIKIPGGFFELIKTEKKGKRKQKPVDYPKTLVLYYTREPRFKARVIGLEDNNIVLDQTGFYPESGGQAADTGTLNGANVLYVEKKSGVVFHKVNDKDISKFKIGAEVSGAVNLERRKQISRNHTAAHLLNAACRKVLGPHIWQAGAHKDESKAHLDITHYKRITDGELRKIETKVNEFVLSATPVEVEVLPRNIAEQLYGFHLYQGGAIPGRELRIIKINDIDVEACGGTHGMLDTTADIGLFKILKRESVRDGIERIEYTTGIPALEYTQKREHMLKKASDELNTPLDDLDATIRRFFGEWKEQKKTIKLLSGMAVDENRMGHDDIFVKRMSVGKDILKQIAMTVSNGDKGVIVLLGKNNIIFCASGKNSRHRANGILKSITTKLGGKGGGSDRFASGFVEKTNNNMLDQIKMIIKQ